jgi:hypothetical protein
MSDDTQVHESEDAYEPPLVDELERPEGAAVTATAVS